MSSANGFQEQNVGEYMYNKSSIQSDLQMRLGGCVMNWIEFDTQDLNSIGIAQAAVYELLGQMQEKERGFLK
jgi:hypothetical protein